MDEHPNTERLTAFAAGELGDSEMDGVGQHVNDCSECADRLEALSPEFGLPLLEAPSEKPPRAPTDARTIDLDSTFAEKNPSTWSPSRSLLTPTLPERFGRYRILRRIGEGGMGAVYLALDTQLDRRVALKVPSFADDDQHETIGRFYREAQAMAALQHANLCPVFDVGEIEGIHYLTMAFLEGRPLSDYLKGKPQPGRRAATVIRKLARALHSAHEVGIVHRDLKPANIIVKTNHEPVITDFGLSLDAGKARLTQGGMVLGTPAYMSPEQVDGNADLIGPATDLYALGVILYQMLAGHLPYQGSLQTVLHKILEGKPAAPQVANPEVDTALQSICLKCMAARIQHRYASANELADDLAKFLKGQRPAAMAEPDRANVYEFTVSCPLCGTRADVSSDRIGQHFRCPDCHSSFKLHAPSEEIRRPPAETNDGELDLTPAGTVSIRAKEAERMLQQAKAELVQERTAESGPLRSGVAGHAARQLGLGLKKLWEFVRQKRP